MGQSTIKFDGIDEEIQKLGIKDDTIPFDEVEFAKTLSNHSVEIEEFDKDEFYLSYRGMQSTGEINPWHEIVDSPVKKFVKKIIRKASFFVVDPIVKEQNVNNEQTTDAMRQIRNYTFQNDERIDELEKEVAELKKELKALKEKQGGQE